jgi:hypothetical protein
MIERQKLIITAVDLLRREYAPPGCAIVFFVTAFAAVSLKAL